MKNLFARVSGFANLFLLFIRARPVRAENTNRLVQAIFAVQHGDPASRAAEHIRKAGSELRIAISNAS